MHSFFEKPVDTILEESKTKSAQQLNEFDQGLGKHLSKFKVMLEKIDEKIKLETDPEKLAGLKLQRKATLEMQRSIEEAGQVMHKMHNDNNKNLRQMAGK